MHKAKVGRNKESVSFWGYFESVYTMLGDA
jgi:hypothetical protein